MPGGAWVEWIVESEGVKPVTVEGAAEAVAFCWGKHTAGVAFTTAPFACGVYGGPFRGYLADCEKAGEKGVGHGGGWARNVNGLAGVMGN